MTRLDFAACLLAAALITGCSAKDSPAGTGDDEDDTAEDAGKGKPKPDSGPKRPGQGSGNDEDDEPEDKGPVVGPPALDPEAAPYVEDNTKGSGLAKDVLDQLKKGGGNCTTKLLYPYDGTIFPVGLTPPTIMWEGATDGAYLKLSYDRLETLDYQIAVGATPQGELKIPHEHWNEIVRRTQDSAAMLVTLSTKKGSAISTCKAKWRIAPGAMVGSLFYNTYNHPDKGGMGAVMRLNLGATKSDVYVSYNGPIPGVAGGPCVSCHSVSANGATLAASTHNYNPGLASFEGASYSIGPEVEPPTKASLPESTFGALTPDGKHLLRMGNPECTAGANSFPRAPNNFPLLLGPAKTTLVDTASGATIPAKGLKDEWYMWMPQFSPKGDKVVFNHARPGPDGKTIRRDLAIMDYDAGSHTFSNLRVIVSNQGSNPSRDYSPTPILAAFLPLGPGAEGCTTPSASPVGAIPGGSCDGPCYPAWPFFTPDGKAVVYALTSEPDFSVAIPGRETPAKSELWYADITGDEQPVKLDAANKGLGDGDSLANYYPTMMPVQVGGYFWVFWTSTRPWGHRQFTPSAGSIASTIFSGPSALESYKKRIWVSAIRQRGEGGEFGKGELTDLSAPAFYLEGQSDTGNVRAFAALNPCKQSGNECSSGLDCCTGFCNIDKGKAVGTCGEKITCANLNERCETTADCCPAPDGEQKRSCIGNFCGYQAPF